MHVDVALQIRLRDQRGQGVFFSGIDLAQVLTQFGRNVVQLEFGIDLFFSFSRDRFLCVELAPGCIR